MSVLMTMLADEILMEAQTVDEIDAIVNLLQLKLKIMQGH